MPAWASRFGVWLLFAAIAGCATLSPPRPPEVGVTAVRIDRLGAGEARFAVILAATNPNDYALAVDALEAELQVEGVVVGVARLEAPVRLPALGATTIALAVRAPLAAALRAVAAVALRLESTPGTRIAVRYAVTGVATLGGGGQFPFRREGELPWPDRATEPRL